jgi:hypothetical protein
MAGGTTVDNIFVYDGQYLSFTVGTAAVTLGQVVKLGAVAGEVETATNLSATKAIGVAVSTRRTSYGQTANSAAVGDRVTVCTRGVVNVTASGTVTNGTFVEACSSGKVRTHTAATSGYPKMLGMALSTATTGNLVKVKLMSG